MSDRFTGRWLVSEYVFNPDGSFVGVIHQRRTLEPLADNRLRVLQQMHVDSTLAAHAMGRFAGEWVFDLVRDGGVRQYHGGDVVGSGQPYGEVAMLGEGVWPRFGYNFTSFALMLSPHRQVTGGKFYAASQMIANIIGVAQAEMHAASDSWPSLRDPQEVCQVSTLWRGESLLFNVDGRHEFTQAVTQEHTATQTHAVYANGQALHITYADDGRGAFDARGLLTRPGTVGQQPLFGKAKRFGWLLESVLHSPQSTRIDTILILDNDSEMLVSLHRWSQGGILRHIEIRTLRPAQTNLPSLSQCSSV